MEYFEKCKINIDKKQPVIPDWCMGEKLEKSVPQLSLWQRALKSGAKIVFGDR